MTDNPLLMNSGAPFGAPEFDKIRDEHYIPAFKAAIDEARKEIDEISQNPEEPDFENTILALEYSGMTLSRIEGIFFNLLESDSSPAMQQIAEEVTPLLTELSLYISLNVKLFERVKRVYDSAPDLDTASRRLLEKTYKSFIRGGAALEGGCKAEYSRICQELELCQLKFSNNVLASTKSWVLHISDADKVSDMPAYVRDMGAGEAASRGLEGWVYTLDRVSSTAFLKNCSDPALRKEMYLRYNSRAMSGEWDNSEIIKRIANLRLAKAKLLGYDDYAQYALETRMAGNEEAVLQFLDSLLHPALEKAEAEVLAVLEFARQRGYEEPEMQAWDFAYWAERLQEEKYSFSASQLKPYFELDSTIEAVLGLANKLYGLSFVERNDIPKYHPDVKVYQVLDEKGEHLALFYADFFPRESKRSGAWMTEFRGHYQYKGIDYRPFISIVANLSKPAGGEPALLSHDDLTTFLHEFGHALHGMLSKGCYPSQCGTSVARDFVELPSQIMENWGCRKEYLDSFAQHYKTGEKIPSELLEKLLQSRNYLSAYYHIRQLRFGIIDMAWHTLKEAFEGDSLAFEREALRNVSVLQEVDGCAICPSFGHIFSGGYSAGYYSYKWAEVLEADAFELFSEKGIFDKEVAQSFRSNILEKGSSEDEALLYRKFRGRDSKSTALLRKLGLLD